MRELLLMGLVACGGAPEIYVELSALDSNGVALSPDGSMLVDADNPVYGATVGMSFPLGPRKVELVRPMQLPEELVSHIQEPVPVEPSEPAGSWWANWFAGLPTIPLIGLLVSLLVLAIIFRTTISSGGMAAINWILRRSNGKVKK